MGEWLQDWTEDLIGNGVVNRKSYNAYVELLYLGTEWYNAGVPHSHVKDPELNAILGDFASMLVKECNLKLEQW